MAIRKGTTKAKGRSYASAVPVPCMTCYYPLNENGYCDACKRRRRAEKPDNGYREFGIGYEREDYDGEC